MSIVRLVGQWTLAFCAGLLVSFCFRVVGYAPPPGADSEYWRGVLSMAAFYFVLTLTEEKKTP